MSIIRDVKKTAVKTNHAWITVTNATRPNWSNRRSLWKKWQTLQFNTSTNNRQLELTIKCQIQNNNSTHLCTTNSSTTAERLELSDSNTQQQNFWFLAKVQHCLGWLGSWVVSMLDSGAEEPGFKSQSRRCWVTVLGKLFTPTVSLFTKQQNW